MIILMNKLLLIIAFQLFYFNCFAQAFTNKRELFKTERVYISDIKCSPQLNYYSYNTGWFRTTLVDKNFKELSSFDFSPLWGGGISDFSFNDSFYFFTKNGETEDTLVVYNISSGEIKHLPTQAATIKSFSTQNKVLLMQNGTFTQYSLDDNSINKTGINVGTKSNEFFSCFDIDSKDSLFYASTLKNRVNIYKLSNFKKAGKIKYKFPSEIKHVKLIDSDKKLVCATKETIYLINTTNKKLEHSFNIDFQTVTEIAFLEKSQLLIISGVKKEDENISATYTLHLPTKTLNKEPISLSNSGVYGLAVNNNTNEVLIADYNVIFKYIVE